MKLAIKKNLINVLAFVGFLWLIYLVNLPLKVMSWDLVKYGRGQIISTSSGFGVSAAPKGLPVGGALLFTPLHDAPGNSR